MNPMDQLKKEHVEIKVALTILGKMCEKFESKEKVNSEHLEQILEFIRGFADKCHHAKEENLLFPELEEAGIPKQGGPIGVMLFEHTKGREYVGAMSESVKRYNQGDEDATSQFIQNARNYIALLTQHIEKEDNILFHMADIYLSRGKKESLLEAFETLEREEIGIGKHEKFHRLLHSLKSIYLETPRG